MKIHETFTVNEVAKIIVKNIGEDRNAITAMLVGMVDNLNHYIPVHHGADARNLRIYLAKNMPTVYLGDCGTYKQFNERKASAILVEDMETQGLYRIKYLAPLAIKEAS